MRDSSIEALVGCGANDTDHLGDLMPRRSGVMPALLMLLAPACLFAQQAPVPVAASAVVAARDPAAALPCDCIALPALTPVHLELLEPIGSKISTTGDTFRLALKDAISVDGIELVPAGTPGIGEIIHAKKSGGSGVGGELIVAARFLDLRGQHIRLRSMIVSSTGMDRTGVVAATSAVVSVLAFAIHGKDTVYPAGTVAAAKTAELAWIPRSTQAATPAAAPSAPASATTTPQPTTTTTPGETIP